MISKDVLKSRTGKSEKRSKQAEEPCVRTQTGRLESPEFPVDHLRLWRSRINGEKPDI